MGTSLPLADRANLREPALPGTSIPKPAHHRTREPSALSGDAMASPSVDHGRRIYVNEQSFVSLAHASEAAARATFQLMGQASVESLVSHEVATHAVVLEGLDERTAREIQDQLRQRWDRGPSELLRHMGYRPQGKGEGQGPPEPLLRPDECLDASCHFSSYYTFATSQAAAQRMFGDIQTIHEVKKQKKAREAYADLTLVSGPRLVLLDDLSPPREAPSEDAPLARRVVDDLKQVVFGETRKVYAQFLDSLRSLLSDTLLRSLGSVPDRVFSRGVLRVRGDEGEGSVLSC